MRKFTIILSFGMAVVLLGCGLLGDRENPPESNPVTPSVESTEVSEGMQTMGVMPLFYLGPTSLEERILESPVIARVQLDSTTSTVESVPTFRGMKYVAILEFKLQRSGVLEGQWRQQYRDRLGGLAGL